MVRRAGGADKCAALRDSAGRQVPGQRHMHARASAPGKLEPGGTGGPGVQPTSQARWGWGERRARASKPALSASSDGCACVHSFYCLLLLFFFQVDFTILVVTFMKVIEKVTMFPGIGICPACPFFVLLLYVHGHTSVHCLRCVQHL